MDILSFFWDNSVVDLTNFSVNYYFSVNCSYDFYFNYFILILIFVIYLIHLIILILFYGVI